MDHTNKVLILAILSITTFYIHYIYLTCDRKLATMEKTTLSYSGVESFSIFPDFTTARSELSGVKNQLRSGLHIKNMNPRYDKLPLREFCVKSSFNSASSGSFMSENTVEFVLSRGFRFLDFPVLLKDGAAHVGLPDSKSTVLLSTIFKTIMMKGFSAPSPNPQDPIFIHLRIQTPMPDQNITAADKLKNNSIYQLIGMNIAHNLAGRILPGLPLEREEFNISHLMGKIVIIVHEASGDYTSLEYYKNCSNEWDKKCYSLEKYANARSGTSSVHYTKSKYLVGHAYTSPESNKDLTSTVSALRIVEPNPDENCNSAAFICNYGVQFLCNNLSVVDSNLNDYEDFFNHFNSAMVPMSVAVPYLSDRN